MGWRQSLRFCIISSSSYICSDSSLCHRKKKHLKTVRAPEVFAKGTDLLVSQILTLWEASTIRIACGSSGTSGEAVQTFMTLTEVQHRICRVWIKSDSYTTDLVSAKRHSVFETSFTAQLGSEETRKEIVT